MSDTKPLTRRETETLNLLAEGLSNDEIAYQLGISPNTVKVHVRNIFEKMNVQSRTEATMEAVRRGWIQVPGIEAPQVEPAAEPLNWPPLESSWRARYLLVLLVVLVGATLFVFWPYRSAPVKMAGAPAFTTDSGSVSGAVTPRQDAPRWSQRAAMPTARSRAGGSQIDGRLYVVGGETALGDTAALEMYDLNLDVWQSLPERPLAARGVGAAALDGKLYVAGGCIGERAIANVDRFDPGMQTWSSVAPLPEARCGLASVALDGRLYAFGGWDGSEVTDTLFIFDPEQERWEEGRRLPKPRAFLGGVSLQGKIYALGGHDGVKQRSEVWAYSPTADAWTPAPSLPEARSGVAVAAEGVSIYVMGGG
jgi:DNA-binding CsgD family transcriptional regulator